MTACRGYAAILAIASLMLLAAAPLHASRPQKTTFTSPSGAAQSPDTQQNGSQKGTNPPPAGSAQHSITVQFDYDFTKTPACTAKLTKACVQKFDVYDISSAKPYLLFSVPVPPNAQGLMKGITATSPRMWFAVGNHRIGVSAQMPDGEKSPPRDCKVIIEIKPDSPPRPPDSH
ncbi:MAG: hypothetical protein WCC97_15460 [Candidatus Acidiferrales bacterium]